MPRELWGSYMGFILATIGSAVGIGNIWRFPYIVGTNGGGAFLLTYTIVIFTFGLSFMILELAIGRYYKTSVFSALARIREKFKWIGLFMVAITFLILSYYMVVLGWILSYLVFAIFDIDIAFEDYTNSFYPVLSFLIIGFINYFIVKSGIRKGIEKFSKVAVLLFISILIPMTIYGITLEGSNEGLSFYLNPDFSKLKEPSVWSVAFGQVFFSLSIGMGVLLTYGSYLNDRQPLLKSSIIIVIADFFVAFFAGLMIFTIVFANDMSPDEGTSLIFKVIPSIFSDTEYGIFIGVLFFLLLLLAGITSSVAMFQIPVSAMQDSLGYNKNKSAIIIALCAVLVGLPAALSYSSINLTLFQKPVFDIFDSVFGTFGLAISAILFIMAVVFFINRKKIMEQVNLYSRFKIPNWLFTIVKYVLPLLLIATLVSQFIFVDI